MKQYFKPIGLFLAAVLAATGCQMANQSPSAPPVSPSLVGVAPGSTGTPTQSPTVSPVVKRVQSLALTLDPLITPTPVIPDPNLRQAVEETLETATPNATVTISADSLAGLTTLVADNNDVQGRIYPGWVPIGGPITSLEGLENCTNLRSLYLESNTITDLSPLAALSSAGKLKFLDLDYNNQLSNLGPLSGLTSLTGLELRSGSAEGDQYYAGAVSDLGPLSNLTNMDLLEFSAQPVNSLAPLANMSKLTQLFIIGLNDENGPNDGDLSVFQNLTNLRILYAESNNFMDITSMGGLSQLQYANLANNSISDISPLNGWSSAATVKLQYNGVFEGLPSLSGLGSSSPSLYLVLSDNSDYLSGSTINDISNLSNVPSLGNPGSVLDITDETDISGDQVSSIQSTYPQLTVVGP